MDMDLIAAILKGNVGDYKPPELTLGKRIGRGMSDFAAGFADPTFASRRRMLEEQIAANLAGQVASDRAAADRQTAQQTFSATESDKDRAFRKSQSTIDAFRDSQNLQRRLNSDFLTQGMAERGRREVADLKAASAEEIRRMTTEAQRAIAEARLKAEEPVKTAQADLLRARTVGLKADNEPATEEDILAAVSGIEDEALRNRVTDAYRAKVGKMTMGELRALARTTRTLTPARTPVIGVPFSPTGGPKVLGNIND